MHLFATHPELLPLALYLLASAIGYVLPETSPAGQALRRWSIDFANKNLKAQPPETPKVEEKKP